MNLYKFRKINSNTVELVKNGTAWFARLTTLNDPFEGDFSISDEMISEISCHPKTSKSARLDNSFELARALRYTLRRKWHILSLSSSRKDILLWSHYADEHKGICIGVKLPRYTNKYNVNLIRNPQNGIAHKVSYSNSPIIISNASNDSILNILIQKSEQWRYEEEYRIIIEDEKIGGSGVTVEFGKKFIQSVTFGVNVKDDDIEKFIKDVGRNDIEYSRAVMVHGHFEISTIGI